jgi:hypothetical protein
MTLILSGTDGLSDIDGSAAAPAIRGTDTNTGIFFGADIIGFAEGGAEVARFNADAQFVAAAGTASLPVITTTGDVNTGIFFPAADTVGISTGGTSALSIDASQNITTANKFAKASMPTGSVLQVVQTVKTDVFTTSSTSFVDVTGFSASITPTSATNKILVIASCYASPSLANYAILGKLVRASTDIAIGDARGSSTRVTFSTSTSSGNYSSFLGVTFLDSPATTSLTTYKVQVAAESGSTLLVGGSYASAASYNGSSPIILTLMEIRA